MADAVEARSEQGDPNIFWWLTLGYAALVGMGWLTLAMRRVLQYVQYNTALQAAALNPAIDAELLERQIGFVGSVRVDFLFAFATAAIFAFAVAALARRTWNAWDYATIAVGFPAVLSLVYLCAPQRLNLFFIGPTLLPLLALLYLPGTKAACGVRRVVEPPPDPDVPVAALSRAEIEREITRERALIAQLSQNLDVFEVERAMDTDRFVARYAEGLEEESADNAEWFSIARAVRRSRERVAALLAQLDTVPHE